MTPTLEDVKKVAIECGAHKRIIDIDDNTGVIAFTPEELQAFAQHFKEEGRKEQRESDADFILRTDLQLLPAEFVQPVANAIMVYAEAIRNNTGE